MADRPPLASNGNFDEVHVSGPVGRFFGYLGAAIEIAAGPALIIVLLVVGELQWPGVVGGIAVLCTAGSMGVRQIVSIQRQRRRAERLARKGRPAVAQVISSRSRPLGEEDGVELTLLIEGPEVPAFRTTRREVAHSARDVGDSFDVLVDRSDRIYRVL